MSDFGELGEIAERLLAAPAAAGRPRIAAIDGPSGSGKTSLAAGLVPHLRESVAVVHLDDLYPGWDGLAAAVRLLTEGVLAPMSAGRPGAYHRWDWRASAPGARVVVPVCDVVVVEGSGSGSRPCAPHLSLLVWVDADADLRRTRALARDGELYRRHWQRWADQEAALFAAEGTRERADVVVRT